MKKLRDLNSSKLYQTDSSAYGQVKNKKQNCASLFTILFLLLLLFLAWIN